jgi:hypothetical protein
MKPTMVTCLCASGFAPIQSTQQSAKHCPDPVLSSKEPALAPNCLPYEIRTLAQCLQVGAPPSPRAHSHL